MEIKHQIAARMEALGINVPELAKRVGVSHQAVRHWLTGRSVPRLGKLDALEAALSVKLDFREGKGGSSPTAAEHLQESDVVLLLKISRLPTNVKRALSALCDAVALQPLTRGIDASAPVKSFVDLPPAKGRTVGQTKQRGKTRRSA